MATRFLDQRWPWLVAAAAIVLAFLSTFVELDLAPEVQARPEGTVEDIGALADRDDVNILYILIDTLRSDRLGSYGYGRDTSPALDRLAASGVRFDRHLSQSSWTKCSMASLWTSMYPLRNGVTRFDDVLAEDAHMPAEILKDAGYRTIGIYRNGWVSSNFGFSQGFDVYSRPSPKPIPRAVRVENPTLMNRGTDESATEAALEFLRIHGHEKWFLYLHLMDLHEYVYDEETALFGGSYSDIYDNSIRFTSEIIDVLLQHLEAEGYLDNTLIVINSDHGEAFLERGLEGHARHVYPETTEVPLIMSFPFRLKPGVVVKTRSRNVDVWPTLFDILGIEGQKNVDGQSMLPAILASAGGEAPAPDTRPAIAHLDQTWGQTGEEPMPTVAVAEGNIRYVRARAGERAIEQLFDGEADPDELEDLASSDPETVARLRAVADSYLESEPPWGKAPTREIGEMELNQLRALGYAIP